MKWDELREYIKQGITRIDCIIPIELTPFDEIQYSLLKDILDRMSELDAKHFTVEVEIPEILNGYCNSLCPLKRFLHHYDGYTCVKDRCTIVDIHKKPVDIKPGWNCPRYIK